MAVLRDSFLVPDLTPRDRTELHGGRFRYVFVAESPHVSEIEPLVKAERRPLCGAAGKVWWSALSEILEGKPNEDRSLPHLLAFCLKHQIAIVNAVQLPLDPKVMRLFPKADPLLTIGCSKLPGVNHYKKASDALRTKILGSLHDRLTDPGLASAKIVVLGNDADWLVRAALHEEEVRRLFAAKLAHPSAWWRRGGHYGRISRESLVGLFKES